MHEAGGRDPLRIFDEPVERPGERHESWDFLGPDVGNSATQLTVGCLGPELLATLLEPIVQGLQCWKARDRLKEAMTRILHVLLDLSLLPAGSRIAELGLEHIMAGHRHEADVDVALFATTNLVDRRAHVVVDAATRNATEDTEGMVVGIEQHLVRLQEVCPDDEGPGVAQLRVGDLQLGALIANDRPIFRPVELEGLAWFERQGHKCPAARRLQFPLTIIAPFPRKGSHTIVRPLVAEADKISV
ncbi:hypothetical protein RHAB21_03763 [Pseudorhizobium halotolerans]|uniref:Uncharacterized protein n=1 Tax=Pseudorhizobium halotolerans TaxID=1233081 RepID=A0ABM8PT96_9HYPH|nr:hypothetical protein RHAB21_03763 [Pseudorhizobium halotolerans]